MTRFLLFPASPLEPETSREENGGENHADGDVAP